MVQVIAEVNGDATLGMRALGHQVCSLHGFSFMLFRYLCARDLSDLDFNDCSALLMLRGRGIKPTWEGRIVASQPVAQRALSSFEVHLDRLPRT
ncbi:hypothetical protein ABIE65_005421 [Constrictibacter sp. MBR-5]